MEELWQKTIAVLEQLDKFLLYQVCEPSAHWVEEEWGWTNYALALGTLYLSFTSFCLLVAYEAGVLGTLPFDPQIFIIALPPFIVNIGILMWGIHVYTQEEGQYRQQLQFGSGNQKKQEWKWAAVRLGALSIFLLIDAGFSGDFFVNHQPLIIIFLFNLMVLPFSIHFYFASCDPLMPEDHRT